MVQITPEEVMEKRRPEPAAPYRRRPKSTAGAPEHYIVYRIFDKEDNLLYVGMTKRGALRMAIHYRKPWGREIHDLTIEEHPTKAAAMEIERLAIAIERPKYNVAHAVKEK